MRKFLHIIAIVICYVITFWVMAILCVSFYQNFEPSAKALADFLNRLLSLKAPSEIISDIIFIGGIFVLNSLLWFFLLKKYYLSFFK